MKKNLRIVSAAAAALLAVAPVAAGTVSTVSADVSTRAADPSYYTLSAGLDVFGAEGINGGEAASFITFGLHFNGGNANVPNAKVVTRGDTFIYQKMMLLLLMVLQLLRVVQSLYQPWKRVLIMLQQIDMLRLLA